MTGQSNTHPATNAATLAPAGVRYATAEQASRVYQISISSLRRRAKAGDVPTVRLGRLVRFPIPAAAVVN